MKDSLVVGRNKEEGTINKVRATLLTAALESVMLIATIDSHEERDITTIDIPNAFVHNRFKHIEDYSVVCFPENLAELMVKAAPEIYTNYVEINSKGLTFLYVRLPDALYGIILAAVLS